jgi:hypothetical protein
LPPYYEHNHSCEDDQIEEKLSKIKKMSLKLDEHTKDQNLKTLIKGLLHPNP